MANEQQQTQPQVAIPLPKGKKNAVQIGCICMMLSVAMYGLVFATLTSPILESVNAMGYVCIPVLYFCRNGSIHYDSYRWKTWRLNWT